MDRRESQAASAAAGMVDDVEGEDMSGKTVGHEGYLQKKGDKGVIKRWLKRYFRYYPDDQRISYFKKVGPGGVVGGGGRGGGGAVVMATPALG